QSGLAIGRYRHVRAREMAVGTRDAGWRGGRHRCRLRNPVPPGAPASQMTRQFLIIDADDTLWENNIYFERAFDEFVTYLSHSSLTPKQVRDVLDEIELVNAKTHGYGTLNFARNLVQCYQHLAERDVCDDDLEQVKSFAVRILECPMEVIDGVPE